MPPRFGVLLTPTAQSFVPGKEGFLAIKTPKAVHRIELVAQRMAREEALESGGEFAPRTGYHYLVEVRTFGTVEGGGFVVFIRNTNGNEHESGPKIDPRPEAVLKKACSR